MNADTLNVTAAAAVSVATAPTTTLVFKSFAIFSTLALALGGGLLPLAVRAHPRAVGCANMAAGGVFLAGGFLHLLPSAVSHPSFVVLAFPLPYFLACVGLLCVLGVEMAVRSYKERGETLSPVSAVENGQLSAAALLGALSFHSVAEGLGLGALPGVDWSVYAAIAGHKGLAAFSLGSRLSSQPRSLVIWMVLFALMTPVGIGVGWMGIAIGGEASLAGGICLALSAGTFIYVAIMEVIPQVIPLPTPTLTSPTGLRQPVGSHGEVGVPFGWLPRVLRRLRGHAWQKR